MGKDKQFPDIVAVMVVPRSRSGKLFRELQSGPLPPDLTPYQPTPETMREVRQAFESMGFQVFDEPLGMTLTIEGSRALFASAFNIPETDFDGSGESPEVHLRPPARLKALIQSISLITPSKPADDTHRR